MKILLSLAFIFIVIAILLLFKIDYQTIYTVISSIGKNKTLKKLAKVNSKKSKSGKFYSDVVAALHAMGEINHLYYIILISSALTIIGAFVGISLGNIYLALVLGVALSLIPFIYVRFQYIEYKALILDEMETGLSVITSSIERSGNIEQAFVENVEYINKPLQTVFKQFLYSIQHNVPIDTAIDTMKSKLSHSVFIEWCDNLKNCDRDRSLKTALRPIVNRITDIKIASFEARNILYEVSGEFKAVSMISIFFMILTYWVLPSALRSFGLNFNFKYMDFLIAADVCMLFFFSVRAFLLTKDIDF